MMLKTLATVAAAAGLLAMTTGVPTVHAQPGPDNGNAWVMKNGEWVWSPSLNVRNSEHYSRLVASNSSFRQARMRKECGPITDPQLHEQCISSFNENGSTAYGSSVGPRKQYNNYSGR